MSDKVQLLIGFGSIIFAHAVILALVLLGMRRESRENLARMDRLLTAEREEKNDLLDRIQAPSFQEYANKAIREKKAAQPKDEEKPIEFIS